MVGSGLHFGGLMLAVAFVPSGVKVNISSYLSITDKFYMQHALPLVGPHGMALMQNNAPGSQFERRAEVGQRELAARMHRLQPHVSCVSRFDTLRPLAVGCYVAADASLIAIVCAQHTYFSGLASCEHYRRDISEGISCWLGA